MAGRFIHLHTHSHYTFLQALPKLDELVEKAKAEGMDAVALTDGGTMHGAIEFYKEATKAGIKPILGVDAYLAPRSRHEKDHALDAKRSRIVLLAENNEGYQNLLYLVTKSWTEGFFERPRMDKELLKERGQHLIAILPSFASDISQHLRANDTDGAKAALAEFKNIFGADNVFLEITHHPKVEGHEALMAQVVALGRETGTPLVAQHDVYYLAPEDREATEVMRRIQQGGHGRNEDEDFSFISEAKALELFKDLPEAIENSRKIADRCTVEFKLGQWTFPAVPVSPGFKSHEDELRAKAYAGLATRGMEKTQEVVDRIEYELGIIISKGFAVYYLVVADLLTYAKSAGILTTTRGSAAGSLVGYLTGITNVNPLFYKLPFERFLNPERPKAPDIDMDMADNRRDDMIAYAKRKYGDDHVAQIGTFGTMMARAAVRDVARALGHSYGTGDRIAKLIPIGSQGFHMTIDKALEIEPDLKAIYDEDDDAREIIDVAKRIEGCVRHVGVHAAGVVVAPTPLIEWSPIQPDPKGTGKLITQYDMYSITDEYGGVGLLKFDFLGIKNLAILADAVARVKATRGIAVDIENIPLDDAATFAMLSKGDTYGTFQLGGSGMTRWLKELKPSTIHDINAMVALYRPGPMETIPSYIARKHNPRMVNYIDPRMKEYLEFSHGLLVYQDDVLLTAIKLAGYSWLEADVLRKAMGKKVPEIMQAEKDKLLKGFAEVGGLSQDKAQQLWELIEPFAAYGFNKCLAGDTRVVDGETGVPERIDELMARARDPKVCALDREGRVRVAQAVQVRENGVKEVFRLVTRSGRVIRATANHPLLAFSGWTRLDQLAAGDRIAAPRVLPEPERPVPLAPHEAAALGYLIAEGNLCHPSGAYYYAKAEDEIEDFMRHASRFPNARITLDRSKSVASVYVGRADVHEPNGLFEWLRSLGLLGKKATEKALPARVFATDNASAALVLGKMWQGDGCVSRSNAQTYYATSSRALADDVQLLLTRLGIVSTIHAKSFAYRGGHKTGFTVVVTGHENLARFAETAGTHLLPGKRAVLLNTVADAALRTNARGRGTPDTVPAAVYPLIREAVAVSGFSVHECAVKCGISERVFGFDARKRGYTRETLDSIGEALHAPEILMHARADIFWDEIVSITSDGTEMTYDLSVPEHENFVANNLIVHNSHAASYGKVAYQTSYMKANYPVEYMAALLTADAGDTEEIARLVAEATRMKIPVLPPDVNESGTDFTVVVLEQDDQPTDVSRAEALRRSGGDEQEEIRQQANIPYSANDTPPAGRMSAIRFGLSSIKNFGEGISKAILDEREAHGQYASLADFLSRVGSKNLNRKSLESLIKCGALDSFGRRGTLFESIDRLLDYHRETTAEAPQDSLFGAALAAPELALPEGNHVSLKDKLDWEKELLGIYVSGHPLDAHQDLLSQYKLRIKLIAEDPKPGFPVKLAVLVAEVRTFLTKSGEKMAFVKLEDKTGGIEAVIFPKLFKVHGAAVTPGSCMLVKGSVSNRNGELSIAIDDLKPL